MIDEIEVEDTKIQIRAAELLLRLHRALDNTREKKPLAPETNGIRISLPMMTPDEIKELAAVGFNITVDGDPEPVDRLSLDKTEDEQLGISIER